MIHNRYLPRWLHRLCNAIFGLAICLVLASSGLRTAPDSWIYIGSWWLLYASIPVALILAWVAPRFSIVEGLAGRAGYEELDSPTSPSSKKSHAD